MKVEKILNNSLVLSRDKDGHEVIVMGKGIGFKNRQGDIIDEEAIEKVFVPNDQRSKQEYVRILENVPKEHIEGINTTLGNLKDYWQGELDDRYFLILLDHIAFAIERVQEGIVLQNKLLNEVRIHYPDEFDAGLAVVNELNERLNVNLPEEEAGNIAFHLVNAKTKDKNFGNTVLSMKMLKDMLNIVQYKLKVHLDYRSMLYSRFVTHLQYFIQRFLEEKQLNTKDVFLYEQFKMKYPNEHKCAQSIASYSENITGHAVTDEEKLYLMIHLVRLTTQDE
ncbi:PRD domain-containing protein [Heyndrickxia sporothermodurans]